MDKLPTRSTASDLYPVNSVTGHICEESSIKASDYRLVLDHGISRAEASLEYSPNFIDTQLVTDRLLWWNGCFVFYELNKSRFPTFKVGCGNCDGDFSAGDIVDIIDINRGLLRRHGTVAVGKCDCCIHLGIVGVDGLRRSDHHSFSTDDGL